MSPYFQLIRPLNCLLGAFAVIIGSVVVLGIDFSQFLIQIIFAMFSTFLFMGWGNGMNDYFDREVDKINHPERVIPSGKLTEKHVWNFSFALFFLGAILTIFINFYCILIYLIAGILMYSYEKNLKNIGFIGNITISFLVALTFLYGGFVVVSLPLIKLPDMQFSFSFTLTNISKIYVIIILSLLSFLSTLSREIIKDIEDIKGDVGRKTLPMKIGIEKSNSLAIVLIVIAISLSPLPYLLNIFNIYYLISVCFSIALFVFALFSLRDAKKCQKIIKYAMILGLISFLVGGSISA